MFDSGGKVMLLLAAAALWLLPMGAEQYGPPPGVATSVATAQLPPLPLSALPDGTPAQTPVTAMRVALGDGFEARLLYGYVLDGLVVTRREFRHDATSAISPLDLGIVWGDLAEPGGVDGFEFRTAPRAVWAYPPTNADLPRDWEAQITNNHLIPANQAVSDALMAVAVGRHVRIRGYLVEVTGDHIRPWRSSTRRGDSTLIGGCEIILVTGVDVLPVEDEAT
ncbi:MAG: hypothetical protein AAF376_00705 [Pseudomonadota bacterium]